MEVKWTSEDGKDEIKYEVFNFTGPGVALSMLFSYTHLTLPTN